MLESGRRLHDLGFALLLLKPKSKRPLEGAWTSGERKTWEELGTLYRKGMNLGVRLGVASRLEGGYLCVIDCDVKSGDPKHRLEMEKKLKELFPAFDAAPTVSTGRGNGSRHVYVRTERPAHAFRFAQSSEKVKVLMPSVEATRAEKAALLQDEIERGFRLRHAWEISVMGEGQQVVLPPSIHPDTGHPYRWDRDVSAAIPLAHFADHPSAKKIPKPAEVLGPALPVDLLAYDLSSEIVDGLMSGKAVGDMSAFMLKAAVACLRARMPEGEILSLFTDPETAVGQAAYRHTQSGSRHRAMSWVNQYTLTKAKKGTLACEQFDVEAVVEPLLDETKGAEQAEEIASAIDWKDALERTGEGKIKGTVQNVKMILWNALPPQAFVYDEFIGRELYGAVLPWGGRIGQEVIDFTITQVKLWLSENYGIEPSSDKLWEAVLTVARLHSFHPVRDFLNGLEWDGKPRIDTWLKDYMGAVGVEPYLSAVSRKTLCAMIGRVFEPGIKFDHVLILEGKQGCGKSTAARILAGAKWHTDAFIDPRDKDGTMALRSKWVVELSELAVLTRSDNESMKGFVSRQDDYVRAPYGKAHQTVPRQNIFIGTTNNSDYNKDPTGGRRYWPAKVRQCRFDALLRDRDQLLAEAKFRWELGEPLYLEEPEMQRQAEEEQESRSPHDSLMDALVDTLTLESNRKLFPVDEFSMRELFEFLDRSGTACHSVLAGLQENTAGQMRVGAVLRKMGYELIRRRGGGNRLRVWVKSPVDRLAGGPDRLDLMDSGPREK